MADKRWLKVKQMLIQAEQSAREAAWRKEADGSFKPTANNHYALGWAHAMESARRHLDDAFASKRSR